MAARNIFKFKDFAPLEKGLCELPKIGASWSDVPTENIR
jgi:hypothetical protein